MWLVIWLQVLCTTAAADDRNWLTEARFAQQLNRPLSVHRPAAELRPFLERLAAERRIAILLDRRIDPGQIIDVDVQADYFDDGIARIASLAGCELVILSDTLFITLPNTAQELRTRIQLHIDRLDETNPAPARKTQLLRRSPVSWEMLGTPRETLLRIAERSRLTVENPDAVPHDLWAAGAIAHANSVEGLLLMLTQFDLEFQWLADDRIRIVAAQATPRIRREHRPRGIAAEAAVSMIRERFPEIIIERAGTRIDITGLLEEHEELAILLGERPPRRRPPSDPEPATLEQQRFTLRMVRQPFGGLIQLLRSKGIAIEYDQAELAAAHVDLQRKISLELEQASVEELLSAACREVGLQFRLSNGTVLLFPPGNENNRPLPPRN